MNPNTALRVLQPLAQSASANPLDVLKMKAALSELGHYKAPDCGLSEFPDPALFKAIQAFQRQCGLKEDGVMKPDGPSEAALRSALTPKQKHVTLYVTAKKIQELGRNGDTVLAHITPEEAQLLDAITDGVSINPKTGLLEFWSGKGGYSGPDRTHSPKESRYGSSFDASRDHKNMQGSTNSIDHKGRDRSQDTRATGGHDTLGGGTSITVASPTEEDTPATQNNDEASARRTRTVLAPDNDPSFTSGFFETKQKEEERKRTNTYANEREQQIWGVQEDWSAEDRLKPNKSPVKTQAASLGDSSHKNERLAPSEPTISKRAGDPLFNQMTKTMFNILTNDIASALGLVGVNRISPVFLLPGTKDLLKKPDIKA